MSRRTSEERARKVVNELFVTAPQNQSVAQKLESRAGTPAPGRRTKAPDLEERAAEAFGMKKPKVSHSKKPEVSHSVINLDNLPIMDVPWMRIQETVLEVGDVEVEFQELKEALKLTEALTPNNLEAALNAAEDNARRAHALYIVARVEHEAFDLEMTPVVEAMREAANKELQNEKDAKQRSKAITDADVKGRASVLFPDEWALVQARRSKAEAMLDTLKHFADLWKQRCFSLSTMLHAGKR